MFHTYISGRLGAGAVDATIMHERKLNWVKMYAEPQLQCRAAGHTSGQHEVQADVQAEVQAEVQEAPEGLRTTSELAARPVNALQATLQPEKQILPGFR